MSMLRSDITSFSRAYSAKARSIVGGALAVAVAALAVVSAPSQAAQAGTKSAPPGKASAQFLSLPFVPTERMSILSGWYYSSSGGFHGGIDYINGSVNNVRSWATFPVVAAADGEACGNCSSRQGNAVWVKHKVNGAVYYTYYGHLASIAGGIALGSQSRTVYVKRGDVLGMAGDTGSRGALHLHFALYNSAGRPLDPYSVGKLRGAYPQPSYNPGMGWFLGQ